MKKKIWSNNFNQSIHYGISERILGLFKDEEAVLAYPPVVDFIISQLADCTYTGYGAGAIYLFCFLSHESHTWHIVLLSRQCGGFTD
jgi:hypothetical protein